MCALASSSTALADDAPLQLWDERYLTLRAGATAQMLLHASIREGYVVVARAGQRAKLVPLTLKLDPPAQLKIGKIEYPSPDAQPAKLEASSADVAVYRGTIEIRVAVRAPISVDPGAHEIKGTLTYQACDPRRCLPRATVPVALIVSIRKPD